MAYEVGKGDFIANLGKIYGYYTGGFIAFTIMLGILEYLGVPNKVIGYLYIFMTIGIYALIGVLSRTSEVSEYYVAGRRVPAFYNGMATGADWMSAASFISMAGALYLQAMTASPSCSAGPAATCWSAILLAPYLRKFGQFTVPDFLGTRYGGHVARFIGILVLLAASFTYVVAQVVRRRHHHLALPRHVVRAGGASSASPASWSARCWAACARSPGRRWRSTSS